MKGDICGFAKGGNMKLEKAGWLKKTLARLKKKHLQG